MNEFVIRFVIQVNISFSVLNKLLCTKSYNQYHSESKLWKSYKIQLFSAIFYMVNGSGNNQPAKIGQLKLPEICLFVSHSRNVLT